MAALEQVTVESIAAGGDGVARAEGMAVFIPRTAPGDVADVRIAPHGRFGRGEVVRLVREGAARVAPRCHHYLRDRCGGCQLQHLDYPAQLEVKRRIVRDALVRIARRPVELPGIVASPLQWEYRSRLALTMRYDGAAWMIGLHQYDNPAAIFLLHECPITDPAVVGAWRDVRAASGLLPQAGSLRGTIRRTGDALSLLLDGGRRWDNARDFAAACPSLQFIRWTPDRAPPRVVVDRRVDRLPAAAFEQVNRRLADLLREAIVQRVTSAHPATAVDAYAGNGATSTMLAERGVAVTAVERDAEAAAFARAHAGPGMSVREASVEDVLGELLPTDVVILNPPRTGVDSRVTRLLEQGPRPATLIYVSCDPATLARDVARLPAYRVTFVEAWDMFPQTAHVETLVELRPSP